MGNSQSSAMPASVPESTFSVAPVLGPQTTSPEQVPAKKPEQRPESFHPGTFEDLHKKTKEIFPQMFEGAKFVVNKGLSNHFQISHNFLMSSTQPSGYKFGATYVGTKQPSPNEAFPVMMSEVSLTGDMLANVIHQWTDSIRTKSVVQVQQNQWVAQQGQMDYRGRDFTATLTAVNPDLFSGKGILVCQYLQNLSRNLSLGAELLYQRDAKLPGKHMGVLTVGGRYVGDDWQLSASFTPDAMAAHLSYYHKIVDNFKIGAELEASARMGEASATVGYEYELQPANLVFRAQADTNWNVGAVLEKRLLPLPFTLSLCGIVNHAKEAYRFGVGMTIG